MSWTIVCDLPLAVYDGNQSPDTSRFGNHATLTNVAVHQGFVSFLGPDSQLEVPVRDESLGRFAALRLQALIKPAQITRRFNIIEGWMSFALFIESDGRLMATVFDGQKWIALDSGTKTVSPNEWSSVMFEYDGVSIASLTLNDAVVGSRLDMPVAIRAPQQVIAMGHWPRGDGRYTFSGDLGPIRIEKRDVDDFMQDAWATALCRRRLTAEQANAVNELVALTEAMDPAEVARLRACAQAQSQRIRELLHELRTFNPRHLVYLRTLGDRLRSAWCCSFDRVAARSALLDYFRLVSGGDPADARLRAWIEEFLDLADMCAFSGKEYDRVRELGAILFPELASYEADLRDIADSV